MTRDQIEGVHRGLVTKVDKCRQPWQKPCRKQKELQKKREEEEKLTEDSGTDGTGKKEKGRRRKKKEAIGRRSKNVCWEIIFRSLICFQLEKQ